MKCLISLCFMVLFVTVAAHAQVSRVSSVDMEEIAENLGQGGALAREVDIYKGTPYFSDWVKGYLILDTGARTKTMTFRYDMMYNRIEFIRNGERYVIPAKKLKGFKIKTTGSYIIFKNGFKTGIDNINDNSLLHIIVNGKVKFLAHHTSVLKRNVPAYSVAGDVNRFVNDTDYYIVTADGIFHKIDAEEDEVYEVLPGDNEQLETYMNSADFSSLKPEQRVKKMVQLYNLILKSESK